MLTTILMIWSLDRDCVFVYKYIFIHQTHAPRHKKSSKVPSWKIINQLQLTSTHYSVKPCHFVRNNTLMYSRLAALIA